MLVRQLFRTNVSFAPSHENSRCPKQCEYGCASFPLSSARESRTHSSYVMTIRTLTLGGTRGSGQLNREFELRRTFNRRTFNLSNPNARAITSLVSCQIAPVVK